MREDADTTIWTRVHARQALVFGLFVSVLYLFFLALPLIAVVTLAGLSTGTTIGVYAVGLSADVILGIVILSLAIRFAVRAARGELFSIPVITPIADRVFPISQR